MDGDDGVDGGCAAEGCGGAFGEAEVVGLFGVDGFGHGGYDCFDGDGAVDAVAGEKRGVSKCGISMGGGFGEGGITNQYQRSTWSVCSLSKLSSMALRM